MLLDIVAKQRWRHHSDSCLAFHKSHGLLDEVRGQKGVRIEEQYVIEVSHSTPSDVIAHTDTYILLAQDFDWHRICARSIEKLRLRRPGINYHNQVCIVSLSIQRGDVFIKKAIAIISNGHNPYSGFPYH